MRRTLLLTSVAVTIAFAMLPAGAAQKAPPSAISITSCEIETSEPLARGDNATPPRIANGVEIGFSNSGTRPINDATFEITYGSITKVVNEHGTFSPGVTIHRRLSFHPLPAEEKPVLCRVIGAHYATM